MNHKLFAMDEVSSKKSEAELDELERKIAEYAEKYYTDGSSPVSDEIFDNLVENLRRDRPNSKVLGVGWGYSTCDSKTASNKVSHRYAKVGSLDKVRNYDELPKFFKTEENLLVDASLKLDGLSIVLYYEDGKLVNAVTRGDGSVGIDVTDKVKLLLPASHTVPEFTGAVRGEILMTYSKFKEYQIVKPKSKNPRNCAAGILNAKDNLHEMKYVTLYVYTILGSTSHTFDIIRDVRCYLEMHFPLVVPFTKFTVHPKMTGNMEQLRMTWNTAYEDLPNDGIVLTAFDLITEDNGIEYKACAYKFDSEIKQSRVVDVIWELSKHNKLIPRVQIKPINLSGSTITYCTGYNAKYIRDHRIGRYSLVTVEKRGEIIPNIQTILESGDMELPMYCPKCSGQLTWDGVNLVCENPECKNQRYQDTMIWIESLAPIDGFKENLMEPIYSQLVSLQIIPEFSVEAIMEAPAKLNYSQLTGGVEYTNRFKQQWEILHSDSALTAYDALLALNIPRLGEITAEKLSPHIKDIYASIVNNENTRQTYGRLKALVGPATLTELISNAKRIRRLKYILNRIQTPQPQPTLSQGKVCITGKLSVKRAQFVEELKRVGFKVSESISKEVLYLITDDPYSSSSKNQQADKFGTDKITEADFRKQFNL